MFGPFSWASGVVYCEGEGGGGKVECRQVSPEGQHPAANGIVAVDGGRTVLVNEIVKGTTTVYDVDAGSKELTVRQEVVSSALPSHSCCVARSSGLGALRIVYPIHEAIARLRRT